MRCGIWVFFCFLAMAWLGFAICRQLAVLGRFGLDNTSTQYIEKRDLLIYYLDISNILYIAFV